MKIAYDYQVFSQQPYGGVSRYFFEISKRISNLNKDSNVSILSPLYINEYLESVKGELKIKGIKIPNIPKSQRLIYLINRLLSRKQLKKFKPDILHETYYSSNTISYGKEKLIITVYDMIHELFPSCFNSSDKTSQIKRKAIDRADHIICISENTRQDLIRLFGIDKEKTSVVPLGVSLNSKQNNLKIKRKKGYILYVGSRVGYKNFRNLIFAYSKNKELNNQYDLIAFGGGEFTLDEKTLFKEVGLNENKVIHESGTDEKLVSFYSDASLFVYPSLYEGFGIPPLEAMSLNCPVACSNSSSMPEVVGNAAAFFDPKSVKSISSAIQSVLEDVSYKDLLISRGQNRIKHFSWDSCSQKTYEIYQKVIQQ